MDATTEEVKGRPRGPGWPGHDPMGMDQPRRGLARAALAVGMTALMALPLAGPAQAHPARQFWRYGKDVRVHKWWGHTVKRVAHRRWHRTHPEADSTEHDRYHHRRLRHLHRRSHLHDVLRSQEGGASWYEGEMGACGVPLSGLYAAHPSWPCGAKVSVRRGSEYVVVRVLDRGPYTAGRVIDLSREAFDRLGDLGAGVMSVKIYHLKRA